MVPSRPVRSDPTPVTPMDDDLDLRHFSNRCRLFPLPNVVLFPHAVLPLHIFEPRYRQMTEDALADDKLVTMTLLRSSTVGNVDTLGSPPIETVGCLGRILQHERLPDGRFKILLLGRKRVRLTRELPDEKLYRIAEAELLDDVHDDRPEEPRRLELIELFRRAFDRQGVEVAAELSSLLEDALPLGVLTDIIAHALGLPLPLKQHLLAEVRIGDRAGTLLEILRQLPGPDTRLRNQELPFPPPFSAN
jgi:Lon protease-like protein